MNASSANKDGGVPSRRRLRNAHGQRSRKPKAMAHEPFGPTLFPTRASEAFPPALRPNDIKDYFWGTPRMQPQTVSPHLARSQDLSARFQAAHVRPSPDF